MNTLIATIGLPRSGKTTWAREQGHPIVCPDKIRLVADVGLVWTHTWVMVRALFLAGHEKVILDACNTDVTDRDECEAQGMTNERARWIVQFHEITTSKEVCIARAERDQDTEIIPAIVRMAQDLQGIVALDVFP